MVLQTMGQDTTQSFKKKLGIFLEDPHCARILDMHWYIYQNFFLKAVWTRIKYESNTLRLPKAEKQTVKHITMASLFPQRLSSNLGMANEFLLTVICFLRFYPSQGRRKDPEELSLENEKSSLPRHLQSSWVTSSWIIKHRFLESPPVTILALSLTLVLYSWLSILSGTHKPIFFCFP